MTAGAHLIVIGGSARVHRKNRKRDGMGDQIHDRREDQGHVAL